MHITIELLSGPNRQQPTTSSIQKNIDALQRAIDGKMTSCDDILLMDTLTVLKAIQKQLPKSGRWFAGPTSTTP